MTRQIRGDQITDQHTVATGMHRPAFLRVKEVEPQDSEGWITVRFWDGSTRSLRPFHKIDVQD